MGNLSPVLTSAMYLIAMTLAVVLSGRTGLDMAVLILLLGVGWFFLTYWAFRSYEGVRRARQSKSWRQEGLCPGCGYTVAVMGQEELRMGSQCLVGRHVFEDA